MAEGNPLFMDIQEVYSGDEFGLPYRDIFGEGIVGASDLEVTAGAGNSVDVAAGAAWVLGDTNVDLQPCYRVFNDAVVNKGISPDASNPRKVRIIAQITDEAFAGTGREWEIQALHGTPDPSPVDPDEPDSAITLATILVPAAAASSASYTITDARARATLGGGQAQFGGTWQDWSPSKITQDAANTTNVAHTVAYGKYLQIGNAIWVNARIQMTAGGTAGQPIEVQGLPGSLVGAGRGTGLVRLHQASTLICEGEHVGATTLRAVAHGTGTYLGSAHTLGSGDILDLCLAYETA